MPGAVEEFWLTVSPYYPPAGSVPDVPGEGLEPLRLAKTVAGELRLTWGTSCWTPDADYSVYRGEITDYSSHAPQTCSTQGATAFETGLTGDSYYYLIVPYNGLNEGSYGLVGVAAEPPIQRPAAAYACRPQVIADCL